MIATRYTATITPASHSTAELRLYVDGDPVTISAERSGEWTVTRAFGKIHADPVMLRYATQLAPELIAALEAALRALKAQQ